MSALWSSSNRWLTWFHRWAGVVLCLVFAMWFASGAVLHFVGFPSLSAAERRAGSEEIDTSKVSISPAQALLKGAGTRELRLLSSSGHPTYALQSADGTWFSVAADTGELLPPISSETAKSAAEHFGHAMAVNVTGPIDYDQWIVHQHFDPFRPLYRVRLNDSAVTDLYVSARTGEVVQRTRGVERFWNWSGAVVHWIYFTPLRKSWPAWNQVVWWLSLAALASCVIGTWLGIVRLIANRRAGRKGLSPFRGWMRRHHILSLFASIVILTWMLSGWLSMDHGRLFSSGGATTSQLAALKGMTLERVARSATIDSLSRVSPATEINFNAIAGRPFLTGYGPNTTNARILYLDDASATLQESLPASLLLSGLAHVWPGEAHRIDRLGDLERLYRRAESTADSAQGFLIAGAPSLRVYVDQCSGRLVAIMDLSRRSYAWIYYALHTLQLPGLIDHPQLRTLIVLTLLAVGFAASVTGIVLSVNRLKREFA
jgi:hypothetical protein